MISKSIVQQFQDNPYRFKYVCGFSAVLLVLLGLPAFDSYSMQSKRAEELREELGRLSGELNSKDFVFKRLVEVKGQSDIGESSFDNEKALALREELVRLTRESRCRLLNVQLSDPKMMPWSVEMHPLRDASPETEDARFALQRTRLTLAAEGTLSRIDQLIAGVTSLHAMAVPTQMVIRKAGDDQHVKVDLTLSLIGLTAI